MQKHLLKTLSFVLAIIITITAIPLTAIPVGAADGDPPKAQLLDCELVGNRLTFNAYITINGDAKYMKTWFEYTINGGTPYSSPIDMTLYPSYQTFSYTIEVEPGDRVEYAVYAKTEFGSYNTNDNVFVVPKAEPEIKLDIPSISSPDVDDTFYAGDDITFKWGSVSNAEEFEWEFYEVDMDNGELLDWGTTATSLSKRKAIIDGDLLQAGKSYTFYVRAINGDSSSKWRMCSVYISAKPSELYADPDELSFTDAAGNHDFDLISSHEWDAYVFVDWIELSHYSGDGDDTITVYVEQNTGAYRVGVITIESNARSITVNVIQDKGEKPILNVDRTEIVASSSEKEYNFSVESNVIDWNVSDNVDWLRLSPTSGDEDGIVKVYVEANNGTEKRIAVITVSGDGITRTITVTQDGRPAIVGDINGDGEITNKDRFLLNRYLANMAGYTNINKTIADINGDGNITQADAEYLTCYLAGWVGYEKLPEPPIPGECQHENCEHIWYKTVWVNNTIKTKPTHSLYHIYQVVCQNTSCRKVIGTKQGVLEENPHEFNADGVCACGAIQIDSTYTPWLAKNATGKTVSVYETPYSTDGSYGKIFAGESVTVLGSKAGRYLIEYSITPTGYATKATAEKKQGYVNTNTIKADSAYYIDFLFESVTLPVSGKEVLLVPHGGYAFYTITDVNGNKVSPQSLKNFTITTDANGSKGPKLSLSEDKLTISGEHGGVSWLSVSFEAPNGEIVYLQTPGLCAVVKSERDDCEHLFTQEEVENIKLALDMFMSSYVPYPNFPEWTTWDSFLYYVENFKDLVVGGVGGIFTGTTGDERATAKVIGEYIDNYIRTNQTGLTNEANVWSEVFVQLVSEIQDMKKMVDLHQFPSDVTEAIQTVIDLADGLKDTKSFKEGLKAVEVLIDSDALSLKILSLLREKGMTLKQFKSNLSAIISSDFLTNNIDYAGLGLAALSTGFEVLAHIVADYEANYKVLQNIKATLDAGNQSDKILIGAIEILETEYTKTVESSVGKIINGALGMGVDAIIGYCPMLNVLLTVSEVVIKYGTTVSEESELILFSQLVFAYALSIRFDTSVYYDGQLVLPYDVARETVKMYLHMALYYNEMALEVNESETLDKNVIQNNCDKIEALMKKFEYYTK